MKEQLQHYIKRTKQRFYIWRKKRFDTTNPGEISAQQTVTYLICKKLMEKENAVLLMAPLSGKRYIRMDDSDLYVVIDFASIQIINNTYSYTIPMHGRMMRKTLDAFDTRIETIRINMKNEITGNIQKSLNRIKESLDN